MARPVKRKKVKPHPSKGKKSRPSLNFLKACSSSAQPDWGIAISEFKIAGRNGHSSKS